MCVCLTCTACECFCVALKKFFKGLWKIISYPFKKCCGKGDS